MTSQTGCEGGERVQHRRVCALAPLDVVAARYQRHRFAPHMHEEFVIGVVEAGACRFNYRNQSHVVNAGQVFVIAPGESHTGEAAHPDGWAYRAIYPARTIVATALGEREGEGPAVLTTLPAVLDDLVLARCLVALNHLLLSAAAPEPCESALVAVLAHVAQRQAAHGPPAALAPRTASRAATRAARIAREYIEAHASSVVRLATLAELTGLNAFSLIRAFRAAFGVPPYAYLNHVRMVRAVQLLRDGHPLSRVAYLSGFSDQSHFTRRFKSALGIPPGQYVRGFSGAGRATGAAPFQQAS